MSKFETLIQIEGVDDGKKAKRSVRASRRGSKTSSAGRGCGVCPLADIKGIKKIFGRVRGKDIFIWGQSPGSTENKEGKEFIGKAGKWWWSECAAAGIDRADCDIQNVVRCCPADPTPDIWPPYQIRSAPNKQEIHCCSIYNERALAESVAKVHIILGQIAAKELLGQEYRKDKRILWSKKLGARVVCLDHPAFFLRRGGHNAPANDPRLQAFRRDLKYAASVAKGGGGKFDYIKSQNYIGVTDWKLLKAAEEEIIGDAAKGWRVSVDLEEGKVDDQGRATQDGSGKSVHLVTGFCSRKGKAWVFPDQHPSAPVTDKFRRATRRVIKRLLAAKFIKFICHHGSYDVTAAEKFLGVQFKHDFDTNYSEFFAYPERHSFALAAITEARFPEFVDYKSITAPECFTTQFKEWLKKTKKRKLSLAKKYDLARRKFKGGTNLALLPWEKMVLYNGADNDLQKRIELSTKNKVSLPLLHVYRDAQFVLDDMERNPPFFDYSHYNKLTKLYPEIEKILYKKLVKISGKKDYNPNSPKQVAHVLYDKLELPIVDDEKPRGTGKEILAILAGHHNFPMWQTEYRRIAKICSTYLTGFKDSADANNGRVRTIWWLTGTRTGRMSSGGGDSGEDGVVNLQNIHGDPLLQCMLVSDTRWRDIYQAWKRQTTIEFVEEVKDGKKPGKWVYKGGFDKHSWREFEDYYVFLGFDHSQMELRCVAQKSGDKNLIKAFQSGKDIHAIVGHALTGWPYEKIQEDEHIRRLVKNMQFGMVYGLNENNLANYMRAKGVENVDDDEVKKFYRKYFETYSGVRDMIESDREFVAEHGYTTTLFGFKRRLQVHQQEGDESEGSGYWGNQAINSPIQGTAHQLMLMGMVPLERQKDKYKLLAKKCQLEIHDAVYFRIRLRNLLRGASLGQEMLEKDALQIVREDFKLDWKVPLKAEPKAAIRFGLQVKDVGGQDERKPGPTTEWDFLNAWCKKNHQLQTRLREITDAFDERNVRLVLKKLHA